MAGATGCFGVLPLNRKFFSYDRGGESTGYCFSQAADPVLGMRVNVVGTTVILETIKRHAAQIQGFVYCSSAAVYGTADKYPAGPLAHDAALLPNTIYGVSKVANEDTARIYWQDYQVPSIGFRPFTVYGPGRDQGMSSTPTKAVLAAILGRPYEITLSGVWTYQYAPDVANCLILAARTELAGAPVFNMGGGGCGHAGIRRSHRGRAA